MGFVTIGLAAFLAVVGILFVLWAVTLRRVVPTNEF